MNTFSKAIILLAICIAIAGAALPVGKARVAAGGTDPAADSAAEVGRG